MNNDIIYPVTKETIHEYAKSIFDPILKGECATTIWVPMAGRRKHNKFIIENVELFKQELPHYDKYILVYIEPLDLTEESLVGYLQLIGKSFLESCKKNPLTQSKISADLEKLFVTPGISYSQLLDTLRNALLEITDSGIEVIFFLGEFDELTFASKVLYKNLKSLWSRLYPRLHYVFLMAKIVDSQDYYLVWDELSETILQNVLYIPLYSGADFDYLIQRFTREFDTTISSEYSLIIKEVCGGHPHSMKVAVRFLRDHTFAKGNQFRAALEENYELQSICTGIYERRAVNEQQILQKITQGSELSASDLKVVKFLLQLGLVIQTGKDYKMFSTLFSQVIKKHIHNETRQIVTKTLTLDPQTTAILYDGETVEERFTRQEYSILALFLKNPGKLLSRDDIGSVLWGESNYEKYSDWAIDQLMSKLRKKLKQIDPNIDIITLRGRGYKFTQELTS